MQAGLLHVVLSWAALAGSLIAAADAPSKILVMRNTDLSDDTGLSARTALSLEEAVLEDGVNVNPHVVLQRDGTLRAYQPEPNLPLTSAPPPLTCEHVHPKPMCALIARVLCRTRRSQPQHAPCRANLSIQAAARCRFCSLGAQQPYKAEFSEERAFSGAVAARAHGGELIFMQPTFVTPAARDLTVNALLMLRRLGFLPLAAPHAQRGVVRRGIGDLRRRLRLCAL